MSEKIYDGVVVTLYNPKTRKTIKTDFTEDEALMKLGFYPIDKTEFVFDLNFSESSSSEGERGGPSPVPSPEDESDVTPVIGCDCCEKSLSHIANEDRDDLCYSESVNEILSEISDDEGIGSSSEDPPLKKLSDNDGLSSSVPSFVVKQGICSEKGCSARVTEKGLCLFHSNRRKDLGGKFCKNIGCFVLALPNGFCHKHLPTNLKCGWEGCFNIAHNGKRCHIHQCVRITPLPIKGEESEDSSDSLLSGEWSDSDSDFSPPEQSTCKRGLCHDKPYKLGFCKKHCSVHIRPLSPSSSESDDEEDPPPVKDMSMSEEDSTSEESSSTSEEEKVFPPKHKGDCEYKGCKRRIFSCNLCATHLKRTVEAKPPTRGRCPRLCYKNTRRQHICRGYLYKYGVCYYHYVKTCSHEMVSGPVTKNYSKKGVTHSEGLSLKIQRIK